MLVLGVILTLFGSLFGLPGTLKSIDFLHTVVKFQLFAIFNIRAILEASWGLLGRSWGPILAEISL